MLLQKSLFLSKFATMVVKGILPRRFCRILDLSGITDGRRAVVLPIPAPTLAMRKAIWCCLALLIMASAPLDAGRDFTGGMGFAEHPPRPSPEYF